MSRKSVTIPLAMVFRKFYCHHCGQQLLRQSRTWTVRPGDPNYKKYAVQRNGGRITFMSGNVEVTEYDFRCPDCGAIRQYNEQLVIENIQKQLSKRCLTESEVRSQETQAKTIINRKNLLCKVLWWIVFVVFAVYFKYLSG